MRRRPRGDGSYRQRPDGLWEARIRIERDGKPARLSFYGKSQREVATKMRQAQARLERGHALPDERITVEAHLREWLESKQATVRPETHRRYRDYCERWLIPELGAKRLVKLTITDVKALHQRLRGRGLSGTTIQHAHNTLKAALNDALRWDRVSRNVASLVPAPRRSTREMRFLGPDDARALLEAAEGEPLEALFVTALTAGLRVGELQALRWKDVDLVRRRIRVVATLLGVDTDGRPIFGEPKTQNSRRTVWLSETAAGALERHKAEQHAARVLAGNAWKDQGLVFTSPLGRPLWRSNVWRALQQLLRKAGLPHLRVHDLRHSAATLLLAQGVPVKVVSEALGHSDVQTTLRIYAHVIEGHQAHAADAMDALFRPKNVFGGRNGGTDYV